MSGLKHPDRPPGPDYKRLILGARVPRVHARGKALAVADHLRNPAPHDEMLKTLRGLKIAFVRRHQRLLTEPRQRSARPRNEFPSQIAPSSIEEPLDDGWRGLPENSNVSHLMGVEPTVSTDSPSGGSSPTRSLERSLRLLEAFDGDTDAAALSELASKTGLAVSTTARLLSTMEHRGFLRRFPDGRFALGPVIMRLGLRATNTPLRAVAAPHLARLAEQTRESANLGVRAEDGRVLYIDHAASPQALRVWNWIGRTIDAEGSAIGAALAGTVEPGGYAMQRDIVEAHITAVAAPVRHHDQGIVAAINVVGPTARISDRELLHLGELVAAEAAQVSKELGEKS